MINFNWNYTHRERPVWATPALALAISLFWRDGVYLVTQWATERSEIILMDRHRGGNWDLMQNCCWFSAVLTTHAHTPFIWCAVSSVYAHSQANGAFFFGKFRWIFYFGFGFMFAKKGHLYFTKYSDHVLFAWLAPIFNSFFFFILFLRFVLFCFDCLVCSLVFYLSRRKRSIFIYIILNIYSNMFGVLLLAWLRHRKYFIFIFRFLFSFQMRWVCFFLVLFLWFVEISLRLAFVTAGPRRTPRAFTISQSTDWYVACFVDIGPVF